jgi:nitroreductase
MGPNQSTAACTPCLAAQARGLGTCIAGGIARSADLLHRHLPGTEKQKILVTIAIGCPEYDAPVNRFRRTRIPVKEFVTFVR